MDTMTRSGPSWATRPEHDAPANAWLVYADQSSAPQPGLACDWPVNKLTQPGDLVFGYLIAPHQSVAFVARAGSASWFQHPTLSGELVRSSAWWARLHGPIPVTPVPLTQLRAIVDADLPMRGRSGRYLPPAAANRLIYRIRRTTAMTPELDRVLQSVDGQPLPGGPDGLDLRRWSHLAAGSLRFRQSVRSQVVEPLLGWALATHPGILVHKGFPVGRREADYVCLRHEEPVCVVGVSVRIRADRSAPWRLSSDVALTLGYAASLHAGAVVADAHDVHLLARGAEEPFHSFTRARVTPRDVAILGRHLAGRDPAQALRERPERTLVYA